MAVLRNRTQKNFTIVSNGILQEKSLSLKERGMLATLLSLPNDWDFTVYGLMQIIPEKKDAINSAINSLEKKGYIKRYRLRDEHGHMKATVIEVFDTPQNDDSDDGSGRDNSDDGDSEEDHPKNKKKYARPVSDKPGLDNPASENPDSDNPTLDNPTLDNPTLGEPTLEEPTLEKPMLENPPQYNTKSNKKLSTPETNENKKINKSNTDSINHSLEQEPEIDYWSEITEEVKQENIERLKKNIGYESRMNKEYTPDFEIFDLITNAVIDFINNPPKDLYVHIANKDRPYDEVLKAFLSMDFYNFNYVRNKLKAMDLTKVTSPGAYALTILYNTYGLPKDLLKKKDKNSCSFERNDYDFAALERNWLKRSSEGRW